MLGVGQAEGGLADGVERGEVDCGAEARAEGGRDGAAPEGRDEARRGADVGYGRREGVCAGLLDAGLEEVDRL